MSSKTQEKEVAIKGAPVAENTKGSIRGKETHNVPISTIIVEEDFNTRPEHNYGNVEELADLIQASGQLIPGLGVKDGDTWKLTCGHRRLKALQLITERTGEEQVMILIKGAKDRKGRLIEQYVENVKETPTDYSRAKIIEGLMADEFEMDADGNPKLDAKGKPKVAVPGYSAKDVQKMLSISSSTLANLKALLKMPEVLQEAVKNNEMTGAGATKVNRALRGKNEEIKAIVEKGREKAKAEGKTMIKDKHIDAPKTRTPVTIMNQCIKRLEAKAEKERLLKNETFTLELFRLVTERCTDQKLNNLIRNGTK